jgi:hypothetical protein
MHRSEEVMICIGNLKKKPFITVVSIAKLKNIVVIVFTHICVGMFCPVL